MWHVEPGKSMLQKVRHFWPQDSLRIGRDHSYSMGSGCIRSCKLMPIFVIIPQINNMVLCKRSHAGVLNILKVSSLTCNIHCYYKH